jgi:predicted lipoprotein with Yx(FWY)xxD motif
MANGTAGAALLAAAALFVAACGGSSGNTEKAASAKPASPAGGALQISTKRGAGGRYLTDGSGRSLYLWVADSGGKSACMGDCAQDWPPLTATSTPSAGNGVTAGDLGTVARSGGAKQVTYKGHPLYYYAGDSGPGKTAGEGSDDFGAKWWLIAPTGAAVKSAGAASSGGTSTSDGGGSDAGGGWS